jgi:hypothetical protein
MNGEIEESEESKKAAEAQRMRQRFRPVDRAEETQKAGDSTEVQNKRGRQVMNEFQGKISEGMAMSVAENDLGLTQEFSFDQTRRGFDGVYRNSKNQLVIVESKGTDKDGRQSLGKKQMTDEGLSEIAHKMQTEGSEYYTAGNSRIGEEILKKGPENIKRYLLWLNPRSLEMTVYEGKPGNMQEVRRFSVIDREGPYPQF